MPTAQRSISLKAIGVIVLIVVAGAIAFALGERFIWGRTNNGVRLAVQVVVLIIAIAVGRWQAMRDQAITGDGAAEV